MKPTLKKSAKAVRQAGRGEDRVLAHVTETEAKALGRFGHTVNPKTGLPEYGLFSIVASIVGAVFGGPIGAAIGGAIGGVAEGQDPFKALVGGALSFGIGQAINFFSEAAGFSTSFSNLFGGGRDLAGGAVAESAGGAAASAAGEAAAVPSGDLVAAKDVAGFGVTPGEFAGTPTNPVEAMSAAEASDLAKGWEGMVADSAAQSGALKTAAEVSGASTGGILNRAMDWAKENQQLAAAGVLAGGGLLKGIGDAAAAREMQEQKLRNAMELEEWKRRFTQGGSYWTGALPFAPAPNTALRRPDGTQVYAGGILNRAMG